MFESENKQVVTGRELQDKLVGGVIEAVDTIKTTIGPSGRCVAIQDDLFGADVSRDGATVAKSLKFSDPVFNMGSHLVKMAASKTEDAAGDGTSTTSVLIGSMVKRGQKLRDSGSNMNDVKRGMDKAAADVVSFIKENSTQIDGDLDKIFQVATIAANNDQEVAGLVVECMKEVGINGVITADMTSDLETKVEVTKGMKLERGWSSSSPQFVTDPGEGKCVLDNPYILVIGERVSSAGQVAGIIEQIMQVGQSRPFLIICDEMDDPVIAMLIINSLQGRIRCCVVKGLDFGDGRRNIMEDVAIFTGGNQICNERGTSMKSMTLEDCGTAARVVISRDSCIIYEGAGDESDVDSRAQILKDRLADPNTSDYDKVKFQKRLAGLVGGIGIIRAGGGSDSEKMNKKQTIEDSILASKSALEEGYCPGAGSIYYRASKELMGNLTEIDRAEMTSDELAGYELVIESLPSVMNSILENAGKSSDIIKFEIDKERSLVRDYGYDAKKGQYGSLSRMGIVDSAKVLRVALQNSVSTASMILLIDRAIIPTGEGPKEPGK